MSERECCDTGFVSVREQKRKLYLPGRREGGVGVLLLTPLFRRAGDLVFVLRDRFVAISSVQWRQ